MTYKYVFCLVNEFMSKKDHVQLSEGFIAKFGELFDFETCGLFMVDREDGGLYKYSMPHSVPKETEDQKSSLNSSDQAKSQY